LEPIEDWQVLWWDESIDASGDARLSVDAATPFEAADHLMGRRRGDAEMALYVCAQSEGGAWSGMK